MLNILIRHQYHCQGSR